MPVIATSKNREGNVVKREDRKEWGDCRTTADVFVADGMQIGSVVQWVTGNNRYEWVLNAGVATLDADVGILIDDAVYTSTLAAATSLTVLNIRVPGATAIVARQQLQYGDVVSAPNQAIVEAALLARGIATVEQV